ncbi:MAG: hypothetical protein KGJ13_00330 [Patescibacteria group bacterium]|nr:hypothetical protein [Patescibacteria group bacterium]
MAQRRDAPFETTSEAGWLGPRVIRAKRDARQPAESLRAAPLECRDAVS